jgi:hypothetical protein
MEDAARAPRVAGLSTAVWGAVALAAAVHLAVALQLDYLSDDAFISFRYARNLARGLGLVFNPGERVEGYTNFLLVVVLAGLHRLGADLVVAGRALSLAGGVATVVLAWLVARKIAPASRLAPLAAPALLAVSPYLAAWSGSGLETTLYVALLLGILLAVLAERPGGRFIVPGILGLLLGLTRPEGVLLFAVAAAWPLATGPGSVSRRLRAMAPGLLLFLLAGGAYFAARWAYFGDLLPNTFHAKGSFTPRHLVRGAEYVAQVGAIPLVLVQLPLAATGAWLAWRDGRRLAVVLLVTCVAVVVLEGGDGLPMYRFMLPALALAAVLVSRAVATLAGPVRRPLALAATAAAVGLSFFPPRDAQYRMFAHQRDYEIPRWALAGEELAKRVPPGTVIAAVPIGAVAYHSDLPTIDMLGLTDRTIARTEIAGAGTGWAGHEKHNGPYVLSRRPELLLLGNVFVTNRAAFEEREFPLARFPAMLAREGDVVRDPAFHQHYRPFVLPLGDGLYLQAFARRDFAERLAAR